LPYIGLRTFYYDRFLLRIFPHMGLQFSPVASPLISDRAVPVKPVCMKSRRV
jgi:hypothetical protein